MLYNFSTCSEFCMVLFDANYLRLNLVFGLFYFLYFESWCYILTLPFLLLASNALSDWSAVASTVCPLYIVLGVTTCNIGTWFVGIFKIFLLILYSFFLHFWLHFRATSQYCVRILILTIFVFPFFFGYKALYYTCTYIYRVQFNCVNMHLYKVMRARVCMSIKCVHFTALGPTLSTPHHCATISGTSLALICCILIFFFLLCAVYVKIIFIFAFCWSRAAEKAYFAFFFLVIFNVPPCFIWFYFLFYSSVLIFIFNFHLF